MRERIDRIPWVVPAPVGWALVCLGLAETIGCFTGPYGPLWPRLGILALLVPVAVTLMATRTAWGVMLALGIWVGDHPAWSPAYNAVDVLPIGVACAILVAQASRTVVLGTVLFVPAFALLAGPVLDEPVGPLLSLIFAGIGTTIGIAVRLARRRKSQATGRINDLRSGIGRIRAGERATLAAELSTTLVGALGERSADLRSTAGEGGREELKLLLRHSAATARTSLGSLRSLVTTLRAGPASGSSPTLLDAVDDVEELLVAQGFPSELDLPGTDELASTPAPALLVRVLRATAAEMPDHAVPGATWRLRLEVGRAGTFTSLAYPLSWPQERLSREWQALEAEAAALGGELSVHEEGVDLIVDLRLPTDDSQPSLPSSRRHQGRVGRTLLVALPAWWARTAPLVLWAGALVALAFRLPELGDPRTRWVVLLLPSLLTLAGLTVLRPRTAWWFAVPLMFVAVATDPRFPLAHSVGTLTVILVAALSSYLGVRHLLVAAGLTLVQVLLRPSWSGLDNAALSWAFPYALIIAAPLGIGIRYFMDARARQLAELRDLRAQAGTAREEERRQLAGELHDLVAHRLSLAALEVDAHEQGDLEELRAAVINVARITDEARADLERLVHLLRTEHDVATPGATGAVPPDDTAATPSRTLASVTDTLAAAGCTVLVTGDTERLDTLGRTTARTLTRALLETTTNVLRHADRERPVRLALTEEEAGLRLEVRNGIPAHPTQHPDSTGLGLVGLRERVLLTGGGFRAAPEGDEWVVTATLPLSAAERGQVAGVDDPQLDGAHQQLGA